MTSARKAIRRRVPEADTLRQLIREEQRMRDRLAALVEQAFVSGFAWGAGSKDDPADDPAEHRRDMFDYWHAEYVSESFR